MTEMSWAIPSVLSWVKLVHPPAILCNRDLYHSHSADQETEARKCCRGRETAPLEELLCVCVDWGPVKVLLRTSMKDGVTESPISQMVTLRMGNKHPRQWRRRTDRDQNSCSFLQRGLTSRCLQRLREMCLEQTEGKALWRQSYAGSWSSPSYQPLSPSAPISC